MDAKKTIKSVLCCQTAPGHGACSGTLHLRKWVFPFTEDSFLDRGELFIQFSFCAGILSGLSLCNSCEFCHSIEAISPIVSGRLFSWRVTHQVWLLISICLFCMDSWALREDGFDNDMMFRADCSRVSLCPLSSCESFLITKKQLLWWGLSDVLHYGYSNMLLRVVLLLCSFSRIIAVGFLLKPMTILWLLATF